VHASPGDLWRAPLHDADDDVLGSTYGKYDSRIVIYGHIHRPFVRELNTFTVINSGSVGSPFDGDPRASYVLIEDGRPQIVRVGYDLDRETRLLSQSGHPDVIRISETRRRGRFIPVN
jgi:diadenosine tetraphosphatase ApaH/serine/threonine PP2A family protein phosphatase